MLVCTVWWDLYALQFLINVAVVVPKLRGHSVRACSWNPSWFFYCLIELGLSFAVSELGNCRTLMPWVNVFPLIWKSLSWFVWGRPWDAVVYFMRKRTRRGEPFRTADCITNGGKSVGKFWPILFFRVDIIPRSWIIILGFDRHAFVENFSASANRKSGWWAHVQSMIVARWRISTQLTIDIWAKL